MNITQLEEFTASEQQIIINKAGFTNQEQTFFKLRCQGYILKEIAEIMNIGDRTADNYSKKVKKKILKTL